MPQFAPNEVKTAVAPIVAKPAGMNCEAELFLGPDDTTKVATSGRVPFVSTGVAQGVRLPITMPSVGTYHGYIDVFTEGYRFLTYKTSEDIVIAVPAPTTSFAGGTKRHPVAGPPWGMDIEWWVMSNPVVRFALAIVRISHVTWASQIRMKWPIGYASGREFIPDWTTFYIWAHPDPSRSFWYTFDDLPQVEPDGWVLVGIEHIYG